jgi:hypothetical protein
MVKKNETGAAAQAAPSFVVTTVRLGRAQWNALRKAALERALKKGRKADASAVLASYWTSGCGIDEAQFVVVR